MTRKPDGPLRRGWTTGACAAAAAKAACQVLHGGECPEVVTITLPRGERPTFTVADCERGTDWARAGIIKDAGDDPDVTHGALVQATLRPAEPGAGLIFKAGAGVGTVTKPGLPIPPGEPAINPGPRAMIRQAIAEAVSQSGSRDQDLDYVVEIAIPGGERLAKRTLNGRLGIVGGLSVLGTTGIVKPYSCAAWIASIHQGIDVARASGLEHLAAATGSTSEAAVRAYYDLPDAALLDMGDFVGGTLKYLRRNPVPRLTIAGGPAKMIKLAQGHGDLHSSRARVDFEALAADAERLGAPAHLAEAIRRSDTASQVLQIVDPAGLPLLDHIAAEARRTAQSMLADAPVAVDTMIVDRAGKILV